MYFILPKIVVPISCFYFGTVIFVNQGGILAQQISFLLKNLASKTIKAGLKLSAIDTEND
jgi:hypothetical protein